MRTLAVVLALAVAVFGSMSEVTSDQDYRLARAQQTFQQAGLDYPEVDVEFHTKDTCPVKALGVHQDGRVVVCTQRQKVLLHELAHAWIDQNVSFEQRQEYLTLFDDKLECWQCDVPWAFRGTEHAAETLRWHLQGEIARTSDTIAQRERGVAILTTQERKETA